jgi:replicative DNA helicase
MLPGTLHILAARPGMGKSALGWQIAINAALACRDAGAPGGVFVQSLEMGAGELGERALSAFGSIPGELLQRGQHQHFRSALAMAREELADLSLEIDETASLSMQQIAMRAREVHRKFGGLSLVLVDHLHIIAPDADGARRGNGPTQAVGEISRGLKKLSKDLRCPVLALAQLNRGVEARDDKRPGLSDLRQSGDIEQDADSVVFLYRPEYYLPKDAPEQKVGETLIAWQARVRDYDEQKARLAGKAEAIFEKVRGGRPQIARLRWEAETTSFIDETRS